MQCNAKIEVELCCAILFGQSLFAISRRKVLQRRQICSPELYAVRRKARVIKSHLFAEFFKKNLEILLEIPH